MNDLNQLIIKFDYEQNFKDDDFYVSASNKTIFDLLSLWPKWEKNFLNISGEKFSGKTHLINIFIKKFKGIKLNAISLTNDDSEKLPYARIEFIIILLSKFTCINPAKDKLELGKKLPFKSCPSENLQFV